MGAKAVTSLAETLPSKTHAFNIYMDNFFTSIPLFRYLKDASINAAGTTRMFSAGFAEALKVDKNEARKFLPWNHLNGQVVDGVAALLWQDNNVAPFLTSVHSQLNEYVVAPCREPK